MARADIAILGAGSWGTAVAIHLARLNHKVLLWGHKKAHIAKLKLEHCNNQYLPNCPFPPSLEVVEDLSAAVSDARHLMVAVPSHAFSALLQKLPESTDALSWLTKGIDPKSLSLLHQVADKRFPNCQFAAISGPSFAKEVAIGLPTAITLASNDQNYAKELQTLLHSENFRVYFSKDYIGVEIAATVKNVLAIAVGISDGLGFGANARAALITRGLKEMARLGVALGASESSFMGLAALGDLMLTATDNQSRNRRFGLALGQGQTPLKAAKTIGQVVEGRFNATQVCTLAHQYHQNLPVCESVAHILEAKLSVKDAVKELLNRPVSYE